MYELNVDIEPDVDVLERVMDIVLNYDDQLMIDTIDFDVGRYHEKHWTRPNGFYYGLTIFVDVSESTATAWEYKALSMIEARIEKLDGCIQMQSRMTP